MANVEIYTWSTCPFCIRAKALLDQKGVDFTEYCIDGDEAARDRDVARGAVLHALHAHARHAGGVAQHLVERAVQLELDLAGLDLVHQLVDHDGLGLELVTAVDHRHVARDVGDDEGVAVGRALGDLVGAERGGQRHALALGRAAVGEERLDLVGQILVMFVGVFGVVILFKERKQEVTQ